MQAERKHSDRALALFFVAPQTETGGHMITPLPGAWPEKPGSATLPFFGVRPVVLDDKGNELQARRRCVPRGASLGVPC
jgi:acyl-coenzyme A synthetase/AMP-(fatty) acid ligase